MEQSNNASIAMQRFAAAVVVLFAHGAREHFPSVDTCLSLLLLMSPTSERGFVQRRQAITDMQREL